MLIIERDAKTARSLPSKFMTEIAARGSGSGSAFVFEPIETNSFSPFGDATTFRVQCWR